MDKFSDYPTSLTAPARDAAAVTPDDATDLPVLPRAIYIGQTGDVSARLAGGQSVGGEGTPILASRAGPPPRPARRRQCCYRPMI